MIVRLLFLILGLVSGLAWTARADDFTAFPASADFRLGVEKETFSLVNQYRAAHDLPPLEWSEAILKEARGHSRDMASGEVDFGHDGFSGRVGRLKEGQTGFRGAGENVLMTDDLQNVARKAVDLWLRSPHHLANIRGDFNYTAVGVWQDKNGTLYFTQIFLKLAAPTPAEEAGNVPPPGVVTPFGMLAPGQARARP